MLSLNLLISDECILYIYFRSKSNTIHNKEKKTGNVCCSICLSDLRSHSHSLYILYNSSSPLLNHGKSAPIFWRSVIQGEGPHLLYYRILQRPSFKYDYYFYIIYQCGRRCCYCCMYISSWNWKQILLCVELRCLLNFISVYYF